uniref:Calmodulin n=1 Tax=Mucochytrium quahogii TaxID=96639 RepID=A0A7S2W6A0_9STRA|eukprot:CAMPEP_0203762212 /NCGR_PEP_ID=MMETSP0098-20131031/15150_1 /ASSEMBLY_ACC=CAM_ASM_000208 /TAXON_ID=96639 /ORGANISM=" , Strain NY0313808BC1" /LENGTH=690 /DNA_ID=CAMNT_0050656543 /DNA_START=8 /DNA_END=2080 /DNA_ORIENTATION=+
MDDAAVEELWRLIDSGEVLFAGTVLKRSEILGRWNPRYIRVIRATHDSILCPYWTDVDECDRAEHEPRGIMDASKALVTQEHDLLQVEIRHIKDVLRNSDCFGSRADLVVVLRCHTAGDFGALSGALVGAVAAQAANSFGFITNYDKERRCIRRGSTASIPDETSTGRSAKKVSRLQQDYKLLGELGRGAFSVVYRAKKRISAGNDDPEIAVKVVLLSKLSSRERKTQFRYLNSEVAVMKKVTERLPRNKHVVHLLESFAETRPNYRVCMVLELCNGGELFDRIVQRSHYSEKDAKDVVRKLAGALKELHAIGVVHRDIKPENLIYDSPAEDAAIKITDFGLALDTEYPEKDVYKSHVVGTSGYFAPEVLFLRYSPACDIWSLGVVLYILLVGYPPFVGRTRLQVQKEIRLGRYQFHMPEWKDISQSAQDLISKMLEYRPKERIKPDGVLSHEWLTQAGEEDTIPLSIQKHKQFNNKRKLKAAAYAVMWGTRLNTKRKNKLQGIAQKMKPEGFKPEDLELIKKAFDDHATDHLTDTEQLSKVLSDLGYRQLPLERMFKLFDDNNDGKIDRGELLSGLAALQGPDEACIKFCFSVYDDDGSGEIDKDELINILSMCITNTDLDADKISNELCEAFDDIDADSNGTISFEEFKSACEKKPYLVECLLSKKLSSPVHRERKQLKLRGIEAGLV